MNNNARINLHPLRRPPRLFPDPNQGPIQHPATFIKIQEGVSQVPSLSFR